MSCRSNVLAMSSYVICATIYARHTCNKAACRVARSTCYDTASIDTGTTTQSSNLQRQLSINFYCMLCTYKPSAIACITLFYYCTHNALLLYNAIVLAYGRFFFFSDRRCLVSPAHACFTHRRGLLIIITWHNSTYFYIRVILSRIFGWIASIAHSSRLCTVILFPSNITSLCNIHVSISQIL